MGAATRSLSLPKELKPAVQRISASAGCFARFVALLVFKLSNERFALEQPQP